MNTYTFHTDPGHGWLEVPRTKIVELGISTRITVYSYMSQDGQTVYLEEDCDYDTFHKAMEARGEKYATASSYRENTPIRHMRRFQSYHGEA